jgi:hypothetical protein
VLAGWLAGAHDPWRHDGFTVDVWDVNLLTKMGG